MKQLLSSMAVLALFACNSQPSGNATKDKATAKEDNIYASVDTAGVKTEADLVAQYQKYLDIKKKNKERMMEEPALAISDLSYTAFFISKSTSFMDLESKTYKDMKKSMDSLDAVYNKQ